MNMCHMQIENKNLRVYVLFPTILYDNGMKEKWKY